MQTIEASAMTEEDITTEICALLQQFNTKGTTLTQATDIPAELNIDSVGVLDFIMDVEDKFDIEIPINVVSETHTIGDLVKVVQARIKKA
jgi:acyl carrier protein